MWPQYLSVTGQKMDSLTDRWTDRQTQGVVHCAVSAESILTTSLNYETYGNIWKRMAFRPVSVGKISASRCLPTESGHWRSSGSEILSQLADMFANLWSSPTSGTIWLSRRKVHVKASGFRRKLAKLIECPETNQATKFALNGSVSALYRCHLLPQLYRQQNCYSF